MKHSVALIVWLGTALLGSSAAWAQGTVSGSRIDVARIDELNTAERLVLQEIETAITEARPNVAVDRLLDLLTKRSTRLVEIEPSVGGFHWHLPLSRYLQDRLIRWQITHPEVTAEYQRRTSPIAERERSALESMIASRSRPHVDDARRLIALSEDYLATAQGPELLLNAAQASLISGWFDRAIAIAQRGDSRLQSVLPASDQQPCLGIPWSLVNQTIDTTARKTTSIQPETLPMLTIASANDLVGEFAIVMVAAMRARGDDTSTVEANLLGLLGETNATVAGKAMPLREAFTALPSHAARRAIVDASTLGGNAARGFMGNSIERLQPTPLWVKDLDETISVPTTELDDRLFPEASNGATRTPDLTPVIWQDKVIINTGQAIRAYELTTGKSWPIASRSLPLWRSNDTSDVIKPPLQLPIDNVPQVTLTVADDLLAVRDGSQVTGWLPAARHDKLTASRICLLDLAEEGRMRSGFPWQPSPQNEGIEIEGTPVINAGRMYFGLTRRDAATVQSFVQCINTTGQELWKSELLGASRPVESTSQLRVSHALVSISDGVVYYQSYVGTLAALDAATGDLLWLVQYPRAELASDGYPRRRRAEARDVATTLVAGDLVIVAPADCDRIFAVLRDTGQIVWATAPGEADDAAHLLGITDQHVIAQGDRLYWINRRTGLIEAAFPEGASRQNYGALPSPRGVGRGALSNQAIYFPTTDAIYVFATGLGNQNQTELIQVVDLKAPKLNGGQLVIAGNRLVLTTKNRLAVFVAE